MAKKKRGEVQDDPGTDRIAVPDDFRGLADESDEIPLPPPIPADVALTNPPPATLARGLGYKADPFDARDYKARALFGARRGVRSGIPDEAMGLEACIPGVFDQGMASSCTGHGIGGAIDTRVRRLGRWNSPISSYGGLYKIGRAMERTNPNEPLMDIGAFPRLVMQGVKEYGVPTRDRVPYDVATINDELPWDALQEASTFAISAWWRIDSIGRDRIEDMCQAFAAGYPVAFGLQVDRAFGDFTGKKPVGVQNPIDLIGGHMMYAVGHRTDDADRRVIRAVNSWGTGWGDGGLFWASEEFFLNATDLYVIQVDG